MSKKSRKRNKKILAALALAGGAAMLAKGRGKGAVTGVVNPNAPKTNWINKTRWINATRWINKTNIRIIDLKCGIHNPIDLASSNNLLLGGETPTQLHNNCAGKHLTQQFLLVSPYVDAAHRFVWPVGNLTAIKVGSGHSSCSTYM